MRVKSWNSISATHRRRLAIPLAALVAVLALAASTEVARASHNGTADYVVAQLPLIPTSQGGLGLFTQLQVDLCINNDFTGCPAHPLETLTFAPIGVASIGTTIWLDSSTPSFGNFVAQITDGAVDEIDEDVFLIPGGGGAGFGTSEPMWFDGQAGPGGVDLFGYAIHRIGFRVDSVSFISPGSDPNGDGNWTDISIHGVFLFEGSIATRAACKSGGWQSLHGPGGFSFRNQGQCIRLVNTGK